MILVALLLTVLVPLAQAHCLWMSAPAAEASGSGMRPDHACCAQPQRARPAPGDAADACPCLGLPLGALPAADAAPIAPAGIALGVVDAVVAPVEPPSWTTAAPVLDTGPPAPLVDLGAHGLRAPPTLL